MVGKFRAAYISLYVVFYVKPTKLKNFEDVHVSFKRIGEKIDNHAWKTMKTSIFIYIHVVLSLWVIRDL